MHVCFYCVCFSFLVLSQEIGLEERLRSDLLCVGWDVKPQLSQSIAVHQYAIQNYLNDQDAIRNGSCWGENEC